METDEADPFWCSLGDIPFPQMWEDDAIWLPKAISGKHIVGKFIFDGDRMLSNDIRVTED